MITLGIIGIIAAITIPTITAKYTKKIYTEKLKQTYTILSQALLMAQAEYGDPSSWDFKYVPYTEANPENHEHLLISITETYIIPYLKNINNYKYTTLKDAGYTVYKTEAGNTNASMDNPNFICYIIELANGSTIFVTPNLNNETYSDIIIYIDVNGKKPPNIWGKDAFFLIVVSKTGRLEMLSFKANRHNLITECKHPNGGKTCGALVQQDGWQFKDDYPLKF